MPPLPGLLMEDDKGWPLQWGESSLLSLGSYTPGFPPPAEDTPVVTVITSTTHTEAKHGS